MLIFDNYVTCLKKYVDFSGRATRSEYWYFFLVNFLVSVILGALGLELLSTLYILFILIPGFAVFARRMHDINKSGWNWLWGLIPVAGLIVLLVFLCTPTKSGANKYGK